MSLPRIDENPLDTLPQDSIAEVEEHLLTCSLCQSRLLETDELVTLFHAAATQPDARPTPLWERIPSALPSFRRMYWQQAFGLIQ
jgi:anti-sigma factor RsiW